MTYHISLGSNLGRRPANLARARRLIEEGGAEVVAAGFADSAPSLLARLALRFGPLELRGAADPAGAATALAFYLAGPGVKQNTKLSMEAYATISYEIFEELGRTPDFVAVPVGNGTTIAGIHHGFKSLKKSKYIHKLPKIIASSTPGGNPIIKCFQEQKKKIEDLKPNDIVETKYNDPLVSWISLDGKEALDALWESKGWATYASDEDLLHYSNLIEKEEGLSVLPASSASLVAINQYLKILKPEKGLDFVAVLTGRKD